MKPVQIITTFILGLILSACNEVQRDSLQKDEPIVDFSFQIEGDCSTPVIEIITENKTTSADSFLWDFGDGTISNQVNPKKVYAKAGTYTIKLTAFSAGGNKQIEKQISIIRNSDGTGPIGKLSFTRSNPTSRIVNFEITTTESSYSLSFGDGSSSIVSSEKEINYQYASPGSYSATLILKNSNGCNCVDTLVNLTH